MDHGEVVGWLTGLQAGQFYSGFWAAQPDGRRLPEDNDIRIMLGDICANSDAEISFQRLSFTIDGSDDAVKAALHVISQIRFVTQSQYTIRVKIELANEHKEFVSGKKNGKINKIMGQSMFTRSHWNGGDDADTLGRQRPDNVRKLRRVQFQHRRQRFVL